MEKVRAILGDHRLGGNPVPLTLVNGKYYSLCNKPPSDIDNDKDLPKVKQALVWAWREKNSHHSDYELDDILQ